MPGCMGREVERDRVTDHMGREPGFMATRSDATVLQVARDHVPVCRAARSDATV